MFPSVGHRVSKSRVSITLSQPLSTPHQLTLLGEVIVPESRVVSIPDISLMKANSDALQIDLSREPDALVTWTRPQDIPQVVQNSWILSRGS